MTSTHKWFISSWNTILSKWYPSSSSYPLSKPSQKLRTKNQEKKATLGGILTFDYLNKESTPAPTLSSLSFLGSDYLFIRKPFFFQWNLHQFINLFNQYLSTVEIIPQQSHNSTFQSCTAGGTQDANTPVHVWTLHKLPLWHLYLGLIDTTLEISPSE